MSSDTTSPTPELLSSRARRLGTASALLALALASLDQAVGAILPRVVGELGGMDLYAWVGTAYLVSCAIVVPIAGKFGNLLGRKPFLIAGMIGFMVSSGLCGAAGGMGQLIAARAVQGIFAGILLATVYTVLADLHPPEHRARMQGLASSVFGLSSVLGPLASGAITDQVGWRWVFYLNLPVGLVALAFAATLPGIRTRANLRDIDLLGVALLASGLVPLLIGLSLAGTARGDLPAATWPTIIGGALLLVLFYVVETRVSTTPLVPFALFRDNSFALSIVIAFLSTFGMMAAVYFIPLLYQGVLGTTATHAGSLLAPLMLGLIVTSMLTGRYLSRITRYRYLATAALAVLTVALLTLSATRPDSGLWLPTTGTVLVGLAIGVLLPLTTSTVQNSVKRSKLGVGTSQIQFWRVLSGPVAVAVLGAVLSARLASVTVPADVQLLSTVGQGDQQGALDQIRAGLPPEQRGQVADILRAMREGLADSLQTVFLTAAAIALAAGVASLFMREVPVGSPASRLADRPAEQTHSG